MFPPSSLQRTAADLSSCHSSYSDKYDYSWILRGASVKFKYLKKIKVIVAFDEVKQILAELLSNVIF